MKILLINDPGIPVPPKLYGGIERIVYQLANQYTNLGFYKQNTIYKVAKLVVIVLNKILIIIYTFEMFKLLFL